MMKRITAYELSHGAIETDPKRAAAHVIAKMIEPTDLPLNMTLSLALALVDNREKVVTIFEDLEIELQRIADEENEASQPKLSPTDPIPDGVYRHYDKRFYVWSDDLGVWQMEGTSFHVNWRSRMDEFPLIHSLNHPPRSPEQQKTIIPKDVYWNPTMQKFIGKTRQGILTTLPDDFYNMWYPFYPKFPVKDFAPGL